MDYPICIVNTQRTEGLKEEKELKLARSIIGKDTPPKKIQKSSEFEEKFKWSFMHGKDKTRQ